jgi:hypothetical protein
MRHHLSVERTGKGESRRSHGPHYTAALRSTSSRPFGFAGLFFAT